MTTSYWYEKGEFNIGPFVWICVRAQMEAMKRKWINLLSRATQLCNSTSYMFLLECKHIVWINGCKDIVYNC